MRKQRFEWSPIIEAIKKIDKDKTILIEKKSLPPDVDTNVKSFSSRLHNHCSRNKIKIKVRRQPFGTYEITRLTEKPKEKIQKVSPQPDASHSLSKQVLANLSKGEVMLSRTSFNWLPIINGILELSDDRVLTLEPSDMNIGESQESFQFLLTEIMKSRGVELEFVPKPNGDLSVAKTKSGVILSSSKEKEADLSRSDREARKPKASKEEKQKQYANKYYHKKKSEKWKHPTDEWDWENSHEQAKRAIVGLKNYLNEALKLLFLATETFQQHRNDAADHVTRQKTFLKRFK